MAPSNSRLRGGPAGRAGGRAALGAALPLVAGFGLAACTELAPGTDRLEQGVQPSRPDAAVADPHWGCLEQPASSTGARLVPSVVLSMTIADLVTSSIPEGLTARACAKPDVSCDTPLSAAVSPGEDGAMHLTVPQAFTGFVELTSPSSVPTMYFVNRPLMQDTARNLAIVSKLALNGLAMQARIPLDPTLGHVLVYVFDCTGDPAGDVQLDNDAGGVPFAFVDGLPHLGSAVTSANGIAGFVNVTPGFSLLGGNRVEGGAALGMANVVVRPNWFSYSDLEPL